jgi:hypothetical protein
MFTMDLKNYIHSQIRELDKNRDEQEYTLHGRFSFGLVKQQYEGLPSWEAFVKAKKRLVRLVWAAAFLTTLVMASFFTGVWNSFEQNWIKALATLLGVSIVITLFYSIAMFFSIAFEVNKVNKHVRRLIYEDLLRKMEEKEEGQKAERMQSSH